jgi:hypothetical protein
MELFIGMALPQNNADIVRLFFTEGKDSSNAQWIIYARASWGKRAQS